MKKLLLLILVPILFGCHKENEPINNYGLIEDIEFIREELPQRHVNLFFKITKEEFNAEIDQLKGNVPQLTENQTIIGLMKIFARIGDSHTAIGDRWNSDKIFKAPVKFEAFDDGIFITDIIEAGKSYLGQKVIAINNTPIETIRKMFNTIIPHDNEYFVKSMTASLLRLYQVLNGLGVTNDPLSFTIHLENGEKFTIGGKADDSKETYYSVYNADNVPLYRANNDLNYWYKIIDNSIVYIQYSQCIDMEAYSFESFIDSLFSEIDNMPVNKFIIDIRLNRGGSSAVIMPLYEKLTEHNELKGKIYCCIGDATFSSGELAAIYFKENLNAIMIGEPTGAKPNHYGEINTFELPNSGYIVQYSTRYIANYSDDTVRTLSPDYLVKNYSYDSFKGIDSYIEFIKNNWP